MKRPRKFVTILGVKIPMENVYRATQYGGWVSYRFRYEVLLPPEPSQRIRYIDL